jgi:hypothetical protein
MSNEQWRSADSCKPPTGVAVHIYDTRTKMELVGSYDGYEWRTYLGTTDCRVSKWRPM